VGSQPIRLILLVFGVLVVALTAAIAMPLLLPGSTETPASLPAPAEADKEVARVTAPARAVASPRSRDEAVEAPSAGADATAPAAAVLASAPAAREERGEAAGVAVRGNGPLKARKAFGTAATAKHGHAKAKVKASHAQGKGKAKAKAFGHPKKSKRR
jgi:hypothetical protein